MEPELRALCDRVEEDPLGGVAGIREGAGTRLMLAAHMDEIGLMVTHVDDRGFLRVIPLGGWDARTLVGQRVRVLGREDLDGIVGTTPVHLLDQEQRTKAPKLEDLAVDVGLAARARARAGAAGRRHRADAVPAADGGPPDRQEHRRPRGRLRHARGPARRGAHDRRR